MNRTALIFLGLLLLILLRWGFVLLFMAGCSMQFVPMGCHHTSAHTVDGYQPSQCTNNNR